MALAIVSAARSARLGIVVSDLSQEKPECLLANDHARELLERDVDNLPVDHGLCPTVASAIEERRASGEGQVRAETVTTGGIPVELIGGWTMVDGRPRETLFLCDNAPRRRAERALIASEARFRKLLETAPDAIAIGTRKQFMYANPALVRLLGCERMDEVTRKPLRDHLHPDDRGIARRLVATLLSGAQPLPPTPMRAIRKDGQFVHVELRTMRTEWDGRPALLAIARDLTERRRTQAQLIRADRLAAVGTLAAGIAHEINNPLAYVLLNLQYLLRELTRFDGRPETVERLLERLAEAQHGARRVSTIVNDLRAFSRPEREEEGPVDVRDVVVSALKVANNQIRHRARLVERFEIVPPVEVSPARLEQVIVNLLVNAAQAITGGKPEENEVRVVVRANGDKVLIEVTDTGTGIPPELLDRVFDPFFTTKPRGTGTGLGLPISHSIVSAYGGEIQVESEPGRGSTFRIVLPALIGFEMLASEEPTRKKSRTDKGRGKLLVIDDEPLVADMLERILEEEHEVTIATDPVKARELLLSNEFDLVFCDLLMPKLSGMDLYEQLKERRAGLEERLVFMTGGAFTPRASQFLATITNRTIVKPFDLDEIERVLSDHAHRFSQQPETKDR